jgi:glutathione S-transferase
MHAGFMALRTEMPMDCRASLPNRSITPATKQDIERIQVIWRTCREQSKDQGEWLFGSFTIADAMFAPVVLRFRTYAVDLDEVCRAYCQSILSLPSMRSWLQAAEEELDTLHQLEQ